MPGVLGIVPGDSWSNFVAAARSGVAYTLDSVVLTKQSPEQGTCSGSRPSAKVVQTGSENIRLWWPLAYEAPGTTFTLELTYHTGQPRRFAEEPAASFAHSEKWVWTVTEDLLSLSNLTTLFSQLPFGTSSVPLISSQTLFSTLGGYQMEAQALLAAGNLAGLRSVLSDWSATVRDANTTVQPAFPDAAPPGSGIAGTNENPASCRLLAGCASIHVTEATGISQITRAALDGSAISLTEPKVATLVTPDYFYAQDLSRCSGLKVLGKAEGLKPGGRLLLRGVMRSEGPERVLDLVGQETLSSSGPLPSPLAMLTGCVGGSGCGLVTGFPDGAGAWNGGLRVVVCGRVSSSAPDYFCVDDGSKCADGTVNVGIRIMLLPDVGFPPVGSYVRVTGISAWYNFQGLPQPALLVGTDNDITFLVRT